MTTLFRFIAASIFVLAALPALAQDDDDSTSLDDIPHITIIGTAQADVAPDIATITLGVTTEAPTATAAADATAQKARAIIDAAKAQGVAAPDIATQSVTLQQTFDEIRDPHGNVTGQKPRGFSAENVIAIKVRDLTKAGALAELLITKGANRFDGISFGVENPDPVLAKLTGEAVKNALAQAQIAAEAAGVHLGRVLLIERPSADSPRPMVFAGAARAAAPDMPVEAGTTTLSREVEVSWALDAN